MIKGVPAPFTLNELLVYLRAEELTQESGEDGFRTAREWTEQFDVSIDTMLAVLRKARAEGVLLVAKRRRERVDGANQRVPVYAFDLKEGGELDADN